MSDQIADLFANKQQYWTPTYQRRYVWESKNWEALWRDLIELQKQIDDGVPHKQHFTGTIVTQPFDNSREKFEIIDGQQRLTTFQIVFCVIRDLCASGAYPDDITSEIKSDVAGFVKLSTLQMSKPGKSEDLDNVIDGHTSSYRLLLTKDRDKNAFKSIVSGEFLNQLKNQYSDILEGFKSVSKNPLPNQHPIIEAYGFFVLKFINHLEENGPNIILNLTQTLSYQFHVNHANLGTNDEAQQVFESINDTGKPLDEFDLLRNDLFLRAQDRNKKTEWYNKYWKDFDEDSFWEEPGMTDQFFQDFLVAKMGPMSFTKKRLFHDVYKGEYHEKLKNKLDEDNTNDEIFVEKEFEELFKYAKSFQNMENLNVRIGQSMVFYKDLEITSLRPFLLYLNNELDCSDKQLQEICNILESYVMRRMVNYGYGTNDKDIDGYNRINEYFSQLVAGKEFKIHELILFLRLGSKDPTSWPVDIQILGGIKRRGKSVETAGGLQRTADEVHFGKHSSYSAAVSLLRYIFYRIERYITMNDSLGFKDFLKIPARLTSLREENRNYRSIGNLTFQSGNEISEETVFHDDFENAKATLLDPINSKLKINRDICNYNDWNEKQIIEYKNKLGSYFCNIWPDSDSILKQSLIQTIHHNPNKIYDGMIKNWNPTEDWGYIELLQYGQNIELRSSDIDTNILSRKLHYSLKVRLKLEIIENDDDLYFHAHNVNLVTDGGKHKGKVKMYDKRKGFGFLASEDMDNDIYVHKTQVRYEEVISLNEGQDVEFIIAETTDKLPAAINVRLIKAWHRN